MIGIMRTFLLLCVILYTSLYGGSGFKYSYLPKKVYEKQRFAITIINTQKTTHTPRFEFDKESGQLPLEKKPLIIRNGDDVFYSFYFKAESNEVRIPRITIYDNTDISVLDPHIIPVEPLQPKENFCGVLAADMKINNTQVSHYDKKHYMVTLKIEAYEANLEDIYLPHASEYGVESLHRQGAKVKSEFFAVIPDKIKQLHFSYFNTIKQQYVTMSVPIKLIDKRVTTQSNLNPKQDSFEKLKRTTFKVLAGLFFLLFLIHRDIFYLVLGVVSLITLLTFYVPHKKICVKAGTPLYILPTETSDISMHIAKKSHTSLLNKRELFNKIEYNNGIIGWVKDEDLCKD